MAKTIVLLLLYFAAVLARADTGPCVFETDFPLGEAKLWMRVKSLHDFGKGTPLRIDGSWSMSTARFFGDGKEWSTSGWYALGKTPCDGIYLREEVTSHGTRWEEPGLRTEIRRVKSGFEVTVEATIYNPKGNRDKLVTLSYDLLSKDGDTVASGSRTQRSPADGKSGNNADSVFLLSPDEVTRVARLRLTVATKDY